MLFVLFFGYFEHAFIGLFLDVEQSFILPRISCYCVILRLFWLVFLGKGRNFGGRFEG